jgi:hypothetical protein
MVDLSRIGIDFWVWFIIVGFFVAMPFWYWNKHRVK